jgi:hypothetical protein
MTDGMERIDMDEEVEDFLAHFGVKGMKWGVRRTSGSGGEGGPGEVHVVKRGKVLKTTGGKKLDPADDAVRAAVAKQKAKKSGTQALSNKEYQAMISRMEMDQKYLNLSAKEKAARDNVATKWAKQQAMDWGMKELKKNGPKAIQYGKAVWQLRKLELSQIPITQL